MSQSKNQKAFEEKLDKMKEYSLEDAIVLLKESSFAKFDETLELSINLGVDPRHADQTGRKHWRHQIGRKHSPYYILISTLTSSGNPYFSSNCCRIASVGLSWAYCLASSGTAM